MIEWMAVINSLTQLGANKVANILYNTFPDAYIDTDHVNVFEN